MATTTDRRAAFRFFREGQHVFELDDDDFSELCDIVLEEVARRRGNDVEIIDTVRTTPYPEA